MPTLNEVAPALSMNFVIDRITSRLGYIYTKPILHELDMAKIIVEETLLTYSKYFPHVIYQVIRDEDRVEPKTVASGRYYLKSPTAIIAVNRMVGGTDTRIGLGRLHRRGVYRDGDPIGAGGHFIGGLIENMQINDILAASTLPITTIFEPPNIVELIPRGRYVGNSLVLHTVHPVTLHTIPLSMAEHFIKLAECDVKLALRSMLKKFKSISGPQGEIELDLEDLDEAKNERKELLEQFQSKTMLRANRKKWYVV